MSTKFIFFDRHEKYFTIYTVNFGIEARLLFMYVSDFWSSLVFEFLLNISQNFHDFFSLLFETVFYSRSYGMYSNVYM